MTEWRRFGRGFVYAARGLRVCVREERNFRVHLSVMGHLFLYLPFFSVTRGQVCLLVMLCGLVIALEAVNSALERAVDCSGEVSTRAGAAKDIAAGAVLVAALTAVICGIILLWQPSAFAAMGRFFLRYPFAAAGQLVLFAGVVQWIGGTAPKKRN